jgi:hypothetical protein
MSQASDYLENKILDHLFGKSSYTAPTISIALCTSAPVDSDDGTTISEATYTGYSRVSTASSDWSSASGGSTSNSNEITFGECTGGSDTITHFAALDGSNNLLFYGGLNSSLDVSVSVQPKFKVGELSASLD